MQLPQLRDFSPAAKYAVGVYMVLVAGILVVALYLAYHHMGMGNKASVQDTDAAAVESVDGTESAEDGVLDVEGPGVEVIGGEENTGSPGEVIKTPWFVYDHIKLGHTHINGQTLLFFTVVLLFILSSASSTNKKVWVTLMALSIILHTFGMFWQHKPAFNLVLRASGGLFALSTVVMCFFITKDILSKQSA